MAPWISGLINNLLPDFVGEGVDDGEDINPVGVLEAGIPVDGTVTGWEEHR